MTLYAPRLHPWPRCAALAGSVLASLLTQSAFAQVPAEPTTLHFSHPAEAYLGQRVRLNVHLVDSAGAPVGRVAVSFVTATSFLGATGEVVIAQATTDRQGLGTAEFEVRDGGRLAIRAEFPGNERYAPSSADGSILVTESARQLYVERVGVRIPGLNAPPALAPSLVSEDLSLEAVTGMATLWPWLSGWPIAAALLVVWTLYGYVVVLMFRVAGSGDDKANPSERRSSTR